MDKDAFLQYQQESKNWLHRSRRDLMLHLLGSIVHNNNDLSILEIGAGVGQHTIYLQKFGKVDVVEINKVGIKALHSIPRVRQIISQPIPFDSNEIYDLIVAMDVLEHIKNDISAVDWIVNRLKSKGFLLITLPAYQSIFSEHDIAVHHFRRYSISNLKTILPNNIKLIKYGYFITTLFPFVASFRLYKKFFLRFKNNKTAFIARKQSNLLPKPLDSILRIILKLELVMIKIGIKMPFGITVFCIARKL